MTDRDKLVEAFSIVLADITYSVSSLVVLLKNKGVISEREADLLRGSDAGLKVLADSYRKILATLLAEEKPPEGGDKSFTDSKA